MDIEIYKYIDNKPSKSHNSNGLLFSWWSWRAGRLSQGRQANLFQQTILLHSPFSFLIIDQPLSRSIKSPSYDLYPDLSILQTATNHQPSAYLSAREASYTIFPDLPDWDLGLSTSNNENIGIDDHISTYILLLWIILIMLFHKELWEIAKGLLILIFPRDKKNCKRLKILPILTLLPNYPIFQNEHSLFTMNRSSSMERKTWQRSV